MPPRTRRRKLLMVVDTARQYIPEKKRAIKIPAILQLNDDCLWCIFSYLDLPELLNVESVCKRFKGIAQMFYKNYPCVDFKEISTKFSEKGIRRHPSLMSKIFRKLQSHLVAVKTYDFGLYNYNAEFGRARFPTSVFSNLQHLFLGDPFEIHKKYIYIFPALKQIVLHNYIDLGTNEGIVNRWYDNLFHLKIIKFKSIDSMTGQCLVGLRGIEELCVTNCEYFDEKYFEQFCEMNPQLKKLSFDLSIFYKDYWTDKHNFFLGIITKYLKNLESLVITDDYDFCTYSNDTNYDRLRDLPKVTKLRLDIIDQSSAFYTMLDHFATNNHIEYLNLNYVSEDVMNRVQQFPYLKVLKLRNLRARVEIIPHLLSCSATLEELHIVEYSFASSAIDMKEFFHQFPILRLLNVCGCIEFNTSFIMEIEECLLSRRQMLEIAVNGTPLAQELQKEPKCDFLKDFLDRTKEKLKLTIDTFTDCGMPKNLFYEWDEWDGEQEY